MIKKLLLSISIFFSVFSIYATEAIVIKKRAYIYYSPDYYDKSRSYLIRGDRIQITSSEFDNFVNFVFQHKTTGKKSEGYVRVDDIQFINSSNYTKIIARPGLRLRKTPHLSGRIILTIPYQRTVYIISVDGPEDVYRGIRSRWVKVKYKNFVGWVFGAYLDKYRSGGFRKKKESVIDETPPDYDPSLYDYDPNVIDDSYYNVEEQPPQPIEDEFNELNEEEIFQ